MQDDIYCDGCGEIIDMDDEVNAEFAMVDGDSDETLCAFCNSDESD